MQIFCLSVMSGMPGYRPLLNDLISMGLPRHWSVCVCVFFVCARVCFHMPARASSGSGTGLTKADRGRLKLIQPIREPETQKHIYRHTQKAWHEVNKKPS